MEAVGLVISAIALVISAGAFIFARNAGKRAEFRERLMWMQTLRNELRDMPDTPDAQLQYDNRRVWMRTCLTVAKAYGMREELPSTAEIADRDFQEPWADRINLRDRARREIDNALEKEADRAP